MHIYFIKVICSSTVVINSFFLVKVENRASYLPLLEGIEFPHCVDAWKMILCLELLVDHVCLEWFLEEKLLNCIGVIIKYLSDDLCFDPKCRYHLFGISLNHMRSALEMVLRGCS